MCLATFLAIVCFFIRCRIDKNTFLYNDRRMEKAIFITPRQAAEYLIDVGYTQARIAIESSIPQATVSRIATGRHKDPRLSTAQKLLGLALKVKQGATQETPHGTEARTAGSGNTVEIAALEGRTATESSTSEPAQY